MNRNRLFGFLLLISIVAMIAVVSACAAPTPQVQIQKEVVKETVVVEKAVEVTKVVSQQVVVTSTPPPQAAASSIVIGGFGPLSAPGSFQSGVEMQQAALMAVEEINAAGGALGKKVELIFGDTEGLPERGTAVTERLISQNHVVGLVGEYHSGVGLAEMEVAHKYGIPVIFSETWSNDITAKGYPEVFRIAPTVDYNSQFSAAYAKAIGVKTAVTIMEDTEYGRGQGEANKKNFGAVGITDYSVIYADPKTEDFTPILQRIMQKPPDYLSAGVTGAGVGRLVRQACELGLAPTKKTALTATVDAQYPEFWEAAGDCGTYVFFAYLGLPESLWNDKTKAFVTNFEKRWNHQPGGPAMEAYDSVYMMVEAIKKTGSTDPKALISTLEDLKYTGALGDISFKYGSKNPLPTDQPAWMWHQWPTPNMFMLQYTKKGQSVKDAVVVWPRERSTGPVYTAPPK